MKLFPESEVISFMNARIIHKQITKWQRPFRDAIIHYNGKIHKCTRWRNRRKAQKLADHWLHEYKRRFK